MIRRESVTITTDASGDAVSTTKSLRGMLRAIHYVKDDYADGVDLTIIEADAPGSNLWADTNINASESVFPQVAVNGTDGAAIAGEYGPIPIVGRVSITVAQGGDTKSGTFHIDYEV